MLQIEKPGIKKGREESDQRGALVPETVKKSLRDVWGSGFQPTVLSNGLQP